MSKAYLFGHWFFTLLIAPFTSQAIEYLYGPNPHQVVDLLEVYPITLVFSTFFSLPTFLIYLLCYYFLSKQGVNWLLSKTILIAVSIIGVCITMAIIKGMMTKDVIIAYSVTSFIVGLVLKLKKNEIKNESEIIDSI